MKLLPGWFISENIFLIPSAPKDSYGGCVIKVIISFIWAFPAGQAFRLYYTGLKRKAGIRCNP